MAHDYTDGTVRTTAVDRPNGRCCDGVPSSKLPNKTQKKGPAAIRGRVLQAAAPGISPHFITRADLFWSMSPGSSNSHPFITKHANTYIPIIRTVARMSSRHHVKFFYLFIFQSTHNRLSNRPLHKNVKDFYIGKIFLHFLWFNGSQQNNSEVQSGNVL